MELGLVQSLECQFLFYNKRAILFFHIDDIAIIYHWTDTMEYKEFHGELLDAYEMQELGELR